MTEQSNISEITVIGAGSAGLEFIKKVKELKKDIKITLIDKATHSFDKKKFVCCLDLKNNINLQEFCQNENIIFIQDSVNRINVERKKIYFKQLEPIEYKSLVIATGLTSRNISIKGDHREGLVYFSDIKPLEIKALIKISEEIIIYVTTMLGLRLAASLRAIGKEVRVLGDNWDFLSIDKERVVNFLSEKGINVHLNVSIDEAIGEGQVKATKVNPLKVFSSELVFIDSGFTVNLDFFEEPVNISDMLNTANDIYVIGDALRKDVDKEYFYEFNQKEALAQGDLLADFLISSNKINFERKVLSEEERKKIIEEFLANKETVVVDNKY